MSNTPFAVGEFYHVYNRGTDKRLVFTDESDLDRFIQSMEEFNTVEPIGSIFENSFRKNQLGTPRSKSDAKDGENGRLVKFVAYCLNPNHYHFLLEQLVDNGVSLFMQKLGGGYTKYYNEKYKRSGVLFQGKYKAIHVDSNEYLLHVSVYVNLNNRIHQLGTPRSKLEVKSRSSWKEYTGESGNNRCDKGIILEQFKNNQAYEKFAMSSLDDILKRRAANRDNTDVFLEEV